MFLDRIKKVGYLNFGSLLFWTLSVLCYFFQFPFRWMSELILPFFFLFILFELKNIDLKFNKKMWFVITAFVGYIIFEAVRSINYGIDIVRILRFSALLVGIPFCCLINNKNFSKHLDVLVYLAVAKSVLIISFAVYLILAGQHDMIRTWLEIHKYTGDIYVLNFLPKVQVHGNALLLIAFFVEYMRNKKITKNCLLIFAGVFLAGNFAFILSLMIFAFYRFVPYVISLIKQGKIKLRYIILACSVVALLLSAYLFIKFKEKQEFSNAIRFQQFKILTDTNPIIGSGLGSIIKAKTPMFTYNGDIYFEMQTLYIFNQVGFIGLGLFYSILGYFVCRKGILPSILYAIYLFYSFWNPYCFDLTQMLTTVIILNMIPRREVWLKP